MSVFYSRGTKYYKEENYELAFINYTKAANANDTRAMVSLGHMHKYGRGTEKNNEEALKWYLVAAKLGNSNAMLYIGHMYNSNKDFDNAIRWYLKAADNNNENSYSNLGYLYFYMKDDIAEAIKWFEKSNKVEDLYVLATIYEKKINDYKKAFEIYQKLANVNEKHATIILANYYASGKGVEKDYKKAFELYSKAEKYDTILQILNDNLIYNNKCEDKQLIEEALITIDITKLSNPPVLLVSYYNLLKRFENIIELHYQLQEGGYEYEEAKQNFYNLSFSHTSSHGPSFSHGLSLL